MEWIKQENDFACRKDYLCVKGRSGTGKTLISIHRMLLKARQDKTLRQAYVARNYHLCQAVKQKFPPLFQKVNPSARIHFFTMKNLVRYLEERAVDETGRIELWNQTDSKAMKFEDFEKWYCPPAASKSTTALTARQVWTEIQSIIQGAVTSGYL